MASIWATERAAQCWCEPETEGTVIDVALASVFAELLDETRSKARLGHATTGELLAEVRARVKMDGMLGYSTVHGEEYERTNCSVS